MSLNSLLNDLVQSATVASRICSTSKSRSEVTGAVQQVQKLSDEANQALSANKKRLYSIRKNVVVLSNTCGGILDGLGSGEISPSVLRRIGTSMSSLIVPALSASIEVHSEAIAKFGEGLPHHNHNHVDVDDSCSTSTSNDGDNADSVDSLFLTNEEKNQTLADQDAVKKAQRDKHYKEQEERSINEVEALIRQQKALPSKMTGPYNIVTYPVVPILDYSGFTLRESLTRRGFSLHSLGPYTVFAAQRLIAVDTDRVKAYKVKSVDAYIEHVLASINSTSSTKYVLMSEKHRANPRNPKIWLYWIVPKSRIFDRFKPGVAKDWDLLKEIDEDVYKDNMHRIEHSQQQYQSVVIDRLAQQKAEREKRQKEIEEMLKNKKLKSKKAFFKPKSK